MDDAFYSLPIQLQFLYGQLRTVKRVFELPIEIGIVPRPQLPKLVESGSEEADIGMLESQTTSSKKQRLSDRKVRHGPEEKRRKRWYESIIGKEPGSFEELMGPPRAASASLLQHCPLQTPSASSRKYELLLELSESVKRQSATKKQTKKRRHQSSGKISTDAPPRFPLPIPKALSPTTIRF